MLTTNHVLKENLFPVEEAENYKIFGIGTLLMIWTAPGHPKKWGSSVAPRPLLLSQKNFCIIPYSSVGVVTLEWPIEPFREPVGSSKIQQPHPLHLFFTRQNQEKRKGSILILVFI